MSAPTFQLGDRVTKVKGSCWTGRVVGTYSTGLTPEGYAVESETESGSVQIYPVSALRIAPDAIQPAPDAYQSRVARWMDACFVPTLYSNMTERGDRFLEEVLELLQSHGYDHTRVDVLVDYVYGRPPGEPRQEVGGVMVTLAGYCHIAGIDMAGEGERELARIMEPEVMAKIRRKQEAKNAIHFDTPLPGSDSGPPLGDPATAWPAIGDLVRYAHGPTALAILGQPHAGGWHGDQCMGGSTFVSRVWKPTPEDMATWLHCAGWREGRTTEADERVRQMLWGITRAASAPGAAS